MEGGTSFLFVIGGLKAALDPAKSDANGRDVMIGGGVGTVRQYLPAGLIDELDFALTPVVLRRGEAMFTGIDLGHSGIGLLNVKQPNTPLTSFFYEIFPGAPHES